PSTRASTRWPEGSVIRCGAPRFFQPSAVPAQGCSGGFAGGLAAAGGLAGVLVGMLGLLFRLRDGSVELGEVVVELGGEHEDVPRAGAEPVEAAAERVRFA